MTAILKIETVKAVCKAAILSVFLLFSIQEIAQKNKSIKEAASNSKENVE